MTRTSTRLALALVAAAAALTVHGGEQALPFASASSLVVEQATGKMAYVQGSTLYVRDPARPDVARAVPVAASNPIVVGYRGQHILVSVNGGEGDPGQLVVFDEQGKERVRLPRGEGSLAYPGAGAALSLDGSVVWERTSVDGPTRAMLQLSPEIPDGTTVVVSLDLATGERRVAAHRVPQGSKAQLTVSDVVVLDAEDSLMTLWGGAVMRLKGSAIVWQRSTGAERPWRLFDVHAGRGLVLVGDDTRGLRVLRLADGAELASWQFAEAPAGFERFLEERLGRDRWQQVSQALSNDAHRLRAGTLRVGGAASPVDAAREKREFVLGVWGALFLPDGTVIASGHAQQWAVQLDPVRPELEPAAELWSTFDRADLAGPPATPAPRG